MIDTNQTNDTDEEDKIINNKPLSSETYMKDEFYEESRMQHHCDVEGRNGSKKASGVVGVFVAGHWVDHDCWSRSSWSLWLFVAGNIDSLGRNAVEGNRVQVRAGVSTAQTRKKLAKKPGLAAGWKVVSAKVGTWSKVTGFRCGR